MSRTPTLKDYDDLSKMLKECLGLITDYRRLVGRMIANVYQEDAPVLEDIRSCLTPDEFAIVLQHRKSAQATMLRREKQSLSEGKE